LHGVADGNGRVTGVLRVVLGDQLSDSLSSLTDLDAARDVVLMAEVRDECTYVKHHKQKIVLVLSAMRHFAARLRARGVRVDYVALDDAANTHSLRGEMLRGVQRFRPARVVVTEAAEWRLTEDMRHWHEAAGLELEIRDDLRFLSRRQDFFAWARGKSQLRMEFFYRDMRRRTGLLMDGDQPVGGKWNYDPENRKALPKSARVPAAPRFPPDAVTRAVMALVAREFGGHFGDLDGFAWPVTAEDAAAALDAFVRDRLPFFGDWQDAMKTGEFALFHALISTSLNVGLLDPRAVCDAAAASFAAGHVPLNAAEGFIRQVLGWREFIRGVYWLHMPGYGGRNALAATRKLPWFYWSGETRMNCVHQVVRDTAAHAYAHHIQRLMITGNFALLAALDPDEVDEWYMIVYADAYQWVEMPNTRGMALFADGGVVGSKPYAASGAYINRMSDYCRGCAYDVKDAVGENACPFNYLYWDFMARHRDTLGGNNRLAMPMRTLEKMAPARVQAMREKAARFLESIEEKTGWDVPSPPDPPSLF
jgi:deoxyribodipyrimidine photolyase-related protein